MLFTFGCREQVVQEPPVSKYLGNLSALLRVLLTNTLVKLPGAATFKD